MNAVTPILPALDARSERNLSGVHPDLARVVRRAAALGGRFVVIEGLRSAQRQKELLAAGATRTLDSRHITGHAVDLAAFVDGPRDIRWDWPLYAKLSETVKAAAKAEGVPVTWGGDWKSFRDGPHYELPRDRYPAPRSA